MLSLFINLGLLCYFKYTNFLGETFGLADGRHVHDNGYFPSGGHLFFTFQSLSYTIDVPSPDNASDQFVGLCFLCFLSQLVAGPIVRARISFRKSAAPLFVSNEMFGRGIFLIVSGLFKKVLYRTISALTL